jgi:hypothetical protein
MLECQKATIVARCHIMCLRHNFHFVQGIVVGSVKLYDINVSVGKLSMDIVDARCFDHPPLFTICIKAVLAF